MNQIYSIHIILSWTLTVILAYTYWITSLETIRGTLVEIWCLYRAGN